MKKILVFIDWFLPGYKAGGPVRSMVNIIAHLHIDFEFWVVTSNKDYQEDEVYALESNVWHTNSAEYRIMYLSERMQAFTAYTNIIRHVKPDFIYINGIYSLRFSILPILAAKRLNVASKLRIAPRGMLSAHALNQKSLRKKVFLLAANLIGLYQHCVFHATSNDELEYIHNTIRSVKKVVLAPNLPRIVNNHNASVVSKQSGEVILLFLGRVSPEKNLLYALEILKNLSSHTFVQFNIYGAISSDVYWRSCKQVISEMPENVKINYGGVLHTEMVFEQILQSHFLFLPTTGENFGHSIAECMLLGRPPIISDQTPWQNLGVEKVGWDISLTDTNKFKHIIELVCSMTQNEYTVMSENARTYMKNKLRIDEIKKQYHKLFI